MTPKATSTLIVIILALGFSACGRSKAEPTSPPAPVVVSTRSESADPDLVKRIRTLCDGLEGDIGVAVMHVESGRMIEVEGAKKLPLYSVFKLPLAVTVLKEVEAKRVKLDAKVQVKPTDVAPGSQYNTDLWRTAQEKTVTELIELAIVRSDNTSADKLLQLIGGPSAVTKQMRALGFSNIEIVVTTREFAANRAKPNTGAAIDLVQLIAKLQKGEILQPSHTSLVFDFMERSKTGGDRRLRAFLPSGTRVADKTGTGDVATNDVGLITLPENKGHLAIAVLISGSKLPAERQEKTIADIARAAYDSFVSQPQAH